MILTGNNTLRNPPRQKHLFSSLPEVRALIPRAKSQHLESKMQIACVNWFRYQYPKYQYNLIAIPNGEHRTARTGAILKQQGVLSGVLDLFLAVPRNHYSGLWMEAKVGSGKLSENQIRQKEVFEKAGYKVVVFYSLDQFIEQVNQYLK